MKKIPASVLLDVLNNADSSKIRDVYNLITEINTKKEQVGVKQLFIKINTDDDFLVNGEYSYSGAVPLANSSVSEVYLNTIKNLNFTPLKGKEYKLERFLEFINDPSIVAELQEFNSVKTGGNQTIEAYLDIPSKVINFGSVVIDLES
jgi:hypothetical protein